MQQTMKALVKKGKKGNVETFFPIANWNTLAWCPEDLKDRLAIPTGIEHLLGTPDRFQVVSWIVPPSEKDPNFYSLQYRFRINDVYLSGVTEVNRLNDLWLITGMANGVVGFKLSDTDTYQGIHRQTWRAAKDIRDLLVGSAWLDAKVKVFKKK